MPRKERLFIPHAPALLMLKGNNHEALFINDADYAFFLSCLEQAARQYAVMVHAYTLLPSHVYLMVTADEQTELSRFMQAIGRRYVQFFNRQHHRSGALWEGRYHACHIETGMFLLLTQKYMEQHLVKQIGVTPSDYGWSSLAISEGRQASTWLVPHPEWLSLGDNDAQRAEHYHQFLELPLSAAIVHRIEGCLNQNCVLGTLKYCRELEMVLHKSVQPHHIGRPRKHMTLRPAYWLWFEQVAQSLLDGMSYREVFLPLFSGLHEPIPNQDMAISLYKLRSEGTQACINMMQQAASYQTVSRFWYQGAMFRCSNRTHAAVEQFHQIGAEAFGYAGSALVLEQILLQKEMLAHMKLLTGLELHINGVGTHQEWETYRQALVHYFTPFKIVLDNQQVNWLETQPELILQDTAPNLQRLIMSAPKLSAFLSESSQAAIDDLCRLLKQFDIPFVLNPFLFPEKNYYQHTYLEWRTATYAEKIVVARGGQYLVDASENGPAIPACGFAFTMECLIEVAEKLHVHAIESVQRLDVVLVPSSSKAIALVFKYGRKIRERYPFIVTQQALSSCKPSRKIKQALKQGARLVVEIGKGDNLDNMVLYSKESPEGRVCADFELLSQIKYWMD